MRRGHMLALVCCLAFARPAQGDVPEQAPHATRGVRIDPREGVRVPLTLMLTTPEGTPVPLGDFVGGRRPTLLIFAYARCASLCSVVLHAATDLMRKLPERAPDVAYRPLVVGLDPDESLDAARRHRATLLARLGAPNHPERFPYLLGRREQIARLTDAVGFRYAWDERSQQFAHPAVMIVLDRDGRVFRYLHALGTTADELADALRAANEGTGTQAGHASLAGELLRCFRFDPALRRHQLAIAVYFRIGGLVVLGLLASLVVLLVQRERRRRA